MIISSSDSTTVVEGESVSFVCVATNDPDAIEMLLSDGLIKMIVD